MAPARRVRGIHPGQSLRGNAQKVVDVRLEELLSWRPALEDARRVAELHNMRIAAKRMRYALEMFEVCFPDARPVVKTLTGIQEDLGEIHDLDVFASMLRERLQRLDAESEALATQIMEKTDSRREQSNQLRAVLYGQGRDRRRLGLLGLLGDKIAERRRRYDTFVDRWGGDGLDELATLIRQVTGLTHQDPAAPAPPALVGA